MRAARTCLTLHPSNQSIARRSGTAGEKVNWKHALVTQESPTTQGFTRRTQLSSARSCSATSVLLERDTVFFTPLKALENPPSPNATMMTSR